eukprot:6185313-Pleurochrysis_carterae.AAC.1
MRCSASYVQDACIVNACSECMYRACGHCERLPVGAIQLCCCGFALAPPFQLHPPSSNSAFPRATCLSETSIRAPFWTPGLYPQHYPNGSHVCTLAACSCLAQELFQQFCSLGFPNLFQRTWLCRLARIQ